MRITVTGATGTIGTAAVQAMRSRGDEVVALVRDTTRARSKLGEGVRLEPWPDPKEASPPVAAMQNADAVLHLLGEPIDQRWTDDAKREIRDSRVLSTRSLVSALAAIDPARRPRVLLSQSAVGYYGVHGDEPVDESTPAGGDFLAGVVRDWEREAAAAADSGVRVACTRTGVVLSPHGGALSKMLPPFKLGVGGPVAGGRQYIPWIHIDDVVGGMLRCIDDDRAQGAVNLSAPAPATNAELSHALGHVLRRPAVVPVPALALKARYGEMAVIVLTGQRAIPAKLEQLGYAFKFPELEPALRDVLDG
jgi:uncharacterized protein